jgi:hypothetical protein
MNGADLTALYLEAVKRSGVRPSELYDDSYLATDLIRNFYQGRFLTRPLFLSHQECDRLYQDLANLRSALISLPNRRYGGDLGAFARALGMTEVQITAIRRSRSSPVTQQSRADLYTDPTGFKVLELNMGSALGGIDTSDLCGMMLKHPVLAEFAHTHRLGYADTMRGQVENMFAETGFPADRRPVMATTDWPASFPVLEPFLRHFTHRLRELGIDAYPCHLGQLEVRDGGVWLGDQKVDIIQRLFMLEDCLKPSDVALMEPVLAAVERGEVRIFTPMDSELYASKGALAMLSDEANRELFSEPERASLGRILPWTRMLRSEPVTLEDGRRVDPLEYALRHRQELALKPTMQHGGQGVLLGWQADTDPQTWQERVRAAVDGPYVLQRRVRPVPELFPTDDGDPVPWIVSWGVFTMRSGYGGVYARAMPASSAAEVLGFYAGAYSGGCLHTLPEPG